MREEALWRYKTVRPNFQAECLCPGQTLAEKQRLSGTLDKRPERLPPSPRQRHAPYQKINQYVRRRQRQSKHVLLPKSAGIALGGLIWLHGNVGAAAGDAEHSAGDGYAFLHGLLAQLPGDGPVGPLVAAAVCGPVVDHVDGLGGVYAAAAAVGGGVPDLDGEDLIGLKGVETAVLVGVGGWDGEQTFYRQVDHHGRQNQERKAGNKTDRFHSFHTHPIFLTFRHWAKVYPVQRYHWMM